MNTFLKEAVEESKKSIGGPFGAVIVENDIIVGKGSNSVVPNHDPTAHAEVNAIRDACKNKKTHDLSKCILYSSCEPCCMCLSSCYWSGIKTVYYSNNRIDAEKIGFSDKYIYDQLKLDHKEKDIKLIHKPLKEAKDVFDNWKGIIY